MTYDTAVYTIAFPDGYTASRYIFAPEEAATRHVQVETDVDDEANELIVTVSGDGNVIPVFEDEMRSQLPDEVEVECDVTIGGGGDS